MPILEITNLKKSYRSPDGEMNTIIEVPDFILEKGQQLAVKGESGLGKTTFLNLIAGILQPDSGKIVLDSHEMTGLSESERDRLRGNTIGYIFQTFNLLQGYTALENILMGMMFVHGVDHKLANSLLERVGLGDRKNYLPRSLSVGQQQRVAVARALANQPKLVLADEPTGNLDHKNALEAIKMIREVCAEANASLLLVSHDQRVLEQFDKVVNFSEINLLNSVERKEVIV